ncbi:hypothetical protein HQ403_02405 [Candidatus Kaiserbacteria bacterium]|nr:hypothetical protein [Candidatus Kaiserbacteria bacterium]
MEQHRTTENGGCVMVDKIVSLARYYKEPNGDWDLDKWEELRYSLEITNLPYRTKKVTVPSLDEVEQYAALAITCINFLDWADANKVESLDGKNLVDEKRILYLLIMGQTSMCRGFLVSRLARTFPDTGERVDAIFETVNQYLNMLKYTSRLPAYFISPSIH